MHVISGYLFKFELSEGFSGYLLKFELSELIFGYLSSNFLRETVKNNVIVYDKSLQQIQVYPPLMQQSLKRLPHFRNPCNFNNSNAINCGEIKPPY